MGRTMLTVADAPSPVETSDEGGLMPTALLEPELASTKSTSTRIILFALTVTRFSTFSAAARVSNSSLRRSSFESTDPSSTSAFPSMLAKTAASPFLCRARFNASAASRFAFPLGRTNDFTDG